MTQHEMILSYMEEYGSITPMECFTHLGITKLSTRIGEMRRGGLDIRQEMEKGKNRMGIETRYMRYSLAPEKTNKAGSVIVR